MSAVAGGFAQSNRIDFVRPDAPELATYGPYGVGVRTLQLVDPQRVDVLNTPVGGNTAFSDRPLTVEIWYPAVIPAETQPTTYSAMTRNGEIEASLVGRAVRRATPDRSEGPYPLVIVSHGYPGNRFLMSHLAENVASKGYVAVSIDHTDSTYSDQAAFSSTLLNRPLDQLFVLDEMARLGNPRNGSFLAGLVKADATAILGYSMGGYGALNAVGAGFTAQSVDYGFAPPNGLLVERQAGSPSLLASLDSRIKAVIAVAPWGMNAGFWNAETLAAVVDVPLFFMAGSVDDVAGYENGVRRLFEGTTNTDRYLLTFINANHNAAAPMPAPREVVQAGPGNGYDHYADAVWDTVRMNNIAQHFATAFLGIHLKNDGTFTDYLDLVPESTDGVYVVDEDGKFAPEHTYWHGFPNRTAVGLRLEHLRAGE